MRISGLVLAVERSEYAGQRGPVDVVSLRIEDKTARTVNCKLYPDAGTVVPGQYDVVDAVVKDITSRTVNGGAVTTLNLTELVILGHMGAVA